MSNPGSTHARPHVARSFLLMAVASVCVGAAFGAPCDQSGSGSALANAATNLGDGQWCEFSATYTSGFTTVFGCLPEGGGSIPTCLTYHDSMEWDPNSRTLRFVGGAHGPNKQAEIKHLVYTEASNTWTGNSPKPYSLGGHGYDHSAIDPNTGTFYHRQGDQIFKWAGGSWTTLQRYPNSTGIAGAIEWFPEYGELVFSDGRQRVYRWTSSNGWSAIGSGLSFQIAYHVGAEYNPVHSRMWLYDGGGRVNYEYTGNGNLTRLADAPVSLNTVSRSVSVDTVGGEYIVYDLGTNAWWTFDIAARSWARMNHSMPPLGGNEGGGTLLCSEGSLPDHGVIMYLCWDDRKSYLYKHSPSSVIPLEPPPNPERLKAQGDELP